MSDLPLQIEKICGVPSTGVACRTQSARITLADGQVGMMASVVCLRGEEGDLATFSGDVLSMVFAKLETATGSILVSLKAAQKAIDEYLTGRGVEEASCHLLFFDDVCYVARRGEMKVFVKGVGRGGGIDFEFGSGKVMPGQIYLVGTEPLLAVVKLESIGDRIEEAADGAATVIANRDDQAGMAGLLIKVGEETTNDQRLTTNEADTFEVGSGRRSEVTSKVGAGQPWAAKIGSLWQQFLREVKRVRYGDIGAIFRLRRNIIAAAVVVGLILVLSAVFTLRQETERRKTAEFNAYMTEASGKLSQGTALAQLNKNRARQLLSEAGELVDKALAVKQDEEAKKLQEEIKRKMVETVSVATLELKQVVDMDENVRSLALLAGGVAAISDSKIFDGEVDDLGVSGATNAFVWDSKAYILAGGRVFRRDLAGARAQEILTVEGSDIGVFLGNIYVVSGGGITKYVPIANGYAEGTSYLASQNNFGAGARMAIDGSIWVANGREIFNFLRGERQDFALSGLPGNLGEFSAIYTDVDFSDIYVVDRENSALLVIGKDGTFKRSYQSEEFASAADVAVDGKGKVYVAVGSRVLEGSL